MNKVFLIGRLTRDPELRYTSNNTAVATFSIAVNRTYTNANGEREADFINIIVWRKQAENAGKYLKKGSQVAVDGKIQTRNYDDENGQRRYITEVVADNIEFLTPKNNNTPIEKNYNNMASLESTAPEPNSSKNENNVTPYDFEEKREANTTDVGTNPFEDFGSNIEIDDNELPF